MLVTRIPIPIVRARGARPAVAAPPVLDEKSCAQSAVLDGRLLLARRLRWSKSNIA